MAERNYTVTLEDGTTFPAVADAAVKPEEVLAEAERQSGKKVRFLDVIPEKEGWSVGGLAKDAVRGLVQGSAGAIDLATMAPRAGFEAALRAAKSAGVSIPGREPADFEVLPQGTRAGQALNETLPIKPPASNARRYTRAGLEGLGGAFSAPGGSAALTGATGLASGLSSEAMADLFGDNAFVRGIGSLLGAGGVGLARSIKPNVKALAKETLEGSDPANLAIAADRMRAARDQGLSVNASQAMLRPSNVDDMVEFLANAKTGDTTINNLRQQPNKIAMRAEMEKSRLPGQITSPQDTANRVQEAGTKAIKASEGRANEAFRQQLPPGTQIEVPRIEAFSRALDRYAELHPNTDAQALAKEVKSKLALGGAQEAAPVPLGSGKVSGRVQVTPSAAKDPDYLTDASQLKSAIDDAIQNFGANKLNTSASAKDLNRYAVQIRKLFDQTVATKGTPLWDARAAARQVYMTETNPLKKSVVGRISGPAGASEIKEAPQAQLKAILERGTGEGGYSDIARLEKELRATDPAAFTDLVKTFLADKINKVMPTGGSRKPANLAAQLKATLAGTPNQRRGLDDMLAGVARSQGIPEDSVVRGFNNFIDLLEIAERVPKRISGLPVGDVVETAGKSKLASIFESRFLGSGLGHKIRSVFAADAYKAMDRMLNSPEGLEMLQKLAKTGPNHPGSLVLLQSYLAGLEPSGGP